MSRDLIGKRFVIVQAYDVSEKMFGRTGIALEANPETEMLTLVLDDRYPKEMVKVKRTDVYQVISNEEPSDTVQEDPPVAVPVKMRLPRVLPARPASKARYVVHGA